MHCETVWSSNGLIQPSLQGANRKHRESLPNVLNKHQLYSKTAACLMPLSLLSSLWSLFSYPKPPQVSMPCSALQTVLLTCALVNLRLVEIRLDTNISDCYFYNFHSFSRPYIFTGTQTLDFPSFNMHRGDMSAKLKKKVLVIFIIPYSTTEREHLITLI